MAQVTVLRGEYRNKQVRNQTFRLVGDVRDGAKGTFITVEDNGTLGYPGKAIRVKINTREDITVSGINVADMSDSQRSRANKDNSSAFSLVVPKEPDTYVE